MIKEIQKFWASYSRSTVHIVASRFSSPPPHLRPPCPPSRCLRLPHSLRRPLLSRLRHCRSSTSRTPLPATFFRFCPSAKYKDYCDIKRGAPDSGFELTGSRTRLSHWAVTTAFLPLSKSTTFFAFFASEKMIDQCAHKRGAREKGLQRKGSRRRLPNLAAPTDCIIGPSSPDDSGFERGSRIHLRCWNRGVGFGQGRRFWTPSAPR